MNKEDIRKKLAFNSALATAEAQIDALLDLATTIGVGKVYSIIFALEDLHRSECGLANIEIFQELIDLREKAREFRCAISILVKRGLICDDIKTLSQIFTLSLRVADDFIENAEPLEKLLQLNPSVDTPRIRIMLMASIDRAGINSGSYIRLICDILAVLHELAPTLVDESNMERLITSDNIKLIGVITKIKKYRDILASYSTFEARSYLLTQEGFMSFFSPGPMGIRGLNSIQKKIIDGVLLFTFGDIDSLLDIKDRILALSAIISPDIESKSYLVGLGAWDSIQQIRDILAHECPQNRSTSDPYLGNPNPDTHVVFRDADGNPSTEMIGLLGLTARQDKFHLPTTKKDVVQYISTHEKLI